MPTITTGADLKSPSRLSWDGPLNFDRARARLVEWCPTATREDIVNLAVKIAIQGDGGSMLLREEHARLTEEQAALERRGTAVNHLRYAIASELRRRAQEVPANV